MIIISRSIKLNATAERTDEWLLFIIVRFYLTL